MVTPQAVLPPNAAEFVVDDWIGVESGTLCEFTHSGLTAFFRRYADLPDSHPGVLNDATPLGGYGTPKRERFVQALDHGTPRQQAAILKGVLMKLPVDRAKDRTQAGANTILTWIADLDAAASQADVNIDSQTSSVPEIAREALSAARAHRENGEHHLALDRIHTALHACVKSLAHESGFDTDKNEKLRDQFGAVRKRHPAFQVEKGDRPTADVLQGLSKTVEGLNTARNKNTLVHPTEALLNEPDARLFCNAGITLLQYILDRSEAHRSVVDEHPVATPDAHSVAKASNLHDPFASCDWPADPSSNNSS